MKLGKMWRSCVAAAIGAALVSISPAAHAQDKLKVYVSAGFDGNTWMDASLNLLKAIAKTPEYKDKVTLEIQSARGDAQTQQQQINAMVQAGADVIVAWPISPTALNRAVHNACAKGVTFITWDAAVTEPCSYHVGIDQKKAGGAPAEWLAKELNGKGNIIFMGGIPGTLVDTERNAAAKAVFAKSGIKIVAEAPSMWNPATARQKMSEIIAAKGWDSIDGVWTQTGCYEFAKLQQQAGRTKLLPCAGNGSNGFRVAMLPKGSTDGAMGLRGVSMGSPPWAAPYAFMLGLKVHGGDKTVDKFTEIPMPLVTPESDVLCKKADLAELKEKDWSCTAVPLDLAPANYFIDVWSKQVPQLDLYSALKGTVPAAE